MDFSSIKTFSTHLEFTWDISSRIVNVNSLNSRFIYIFVTMLLIVLLVAITSCVYLLNKKYYLLAGCKRIKTVNGEKLEKYAAVIKGSTIFGNNFDIINITPEKFFYLGRIYAKSRKNYFQFFLFNPVMNVINGEYADLVLNNQNLSTKSVVYVFLEPFLGTGLLTSNGEKWHFRRRLLTPAFHFSILQKFLETFKEETITFLNGLKKSDSNKGVVILSDIIPKFTLNNICATALGVNLDKIDKSTDYRHNIHKSEEFFLRRICNPLINSDWAYNLTADHRQYSSLMHNIHNFTSSLIKTRRIKFKSSVNNIKNTKNIENEEIFYFKKERYAMLDTLLTAETEKLIDHQGICEEVDTFIFEGFDTTSVGLIFSLLLLSLHEDIQEKCFTEISQIKDDLSTITHQDCNNLKYLECVIKESMRLYPPVPMIGRKCTEDTVVGDFILPKGTIINIHIFDIHRDPKYFPNPESFDPDRFLPENSVDRHPFAYIPFSAGQRNCIGQKFAMLEMKILLANVIRNFKLLPVTQLKDIVFEAGMVLRSKYPLEIKIKSRN